MTHGDDTWGYRKLFCVLWFCVSSSSPTATNELQGSRLGDFGLKRCLGADHLACLLRSSLGMLV